MISSPLILFLDQNNGKALHTRAGRAFYRLAMTRLIIYSALFLFTIACSKETDTPEPDQHDVPLTYRSITIDGTSNGLRYENVGRNPEIQVSFTTAIDKSSAAQAVDLVDKEMTKVAVAISFIDNDSVIVIKSSSPLEWLSKYTLTVSTNLKSKRGASLLAPVSVNLVTALDSTDKFPVIPDEELLTLVQKQTFSYFWDFGHPVSGMARERSSSGDIVTTGGTGFGIMAMIVAVERQFISREAAVGRLLKIVRFLRNNATRYHGAFAHWINGSTGQTQPFSEKDNGADLVETSFLFQGVLTARQYFTKENPEETELRNLIAELWEAVEWSWFRHNNEEVLYWHWSPDYGWEMNHKIRGWDECLITYVLAASSPTFPVSKTVYDNGWADNGNIRNNGIYYDFQLPLGPSYGGPLFFAHYSFLGLNPKNLQDQYADYWQQNVNHAKINHAYCSRNPAHYLGYSEICWGLSASDGNNGYSAHSPTNDKGVITPTAALSSMPYTPEESMAALHFFYYKLGNQLWKQYGFIDAFNLTEKWYASDFLAIDQGPIIVMIENYRTGLLWDLFMGIPEIQAGLAKLGFTD